MKRVVIEFRGGVFDGQHFDSAQDNEHGRAARDLYQFFSLVREGAKRQERIEPLGEVIRRDSPAVLERAEAEGWDDMRRRAMMPYYDYAVTDWTEVDDEVLIQTSYVGVNQ